MTLNDIRNLFFPEPDAIPFAKEYAPEVGDEPVYLPTGETVTVTAIGTPYMDNIERYYIEGEGFADWVLLEELF